jgi:hypothetical protein
VLRRWGIDSSQLARIRDQVRTGALAELNTGPGRKPKDQEKEQLRQELARIEEAFKEVSIENTLLRKKIGLGMIGAIRGNRLDPEIKLELVGAVVDAKREGFAISRSCELLMLSRRRFHRWVEDKDLADEPPIPRTVANKITESEREAIIDAAGLVPKAVLDVTGGQTPGVFSLVGAGS